MKTLHALLHSFREEELELIRSLVKSDKDDGASKTLQLFDAVRYSAAVPTRKEMARLVYNAPPDTRITKLASRLEEKVQESLISEKFLEKNTRLTSYAKRRIQLRRRFAIMASIEYMTGFSDYLKKYMTGLISEVEKLSTPIVLVELYGFMSDYSYLDENLAKYYRKRSNYYLKCHEVCSVVNSEYYHTVRRSLLPNTIMTEKKKADLKKLIAWVNRSKQYLFAVNSKIRFAYIKMEYMYSYGRYKTLKQIILDTIQLLSREMKGHIGYLGRLKTELADCEFMLENYEEGKKQFEEGMALLKTHEPNNYSIALIRYCQILITVGELEKALEATDQLEKLAATRKNDVRFSKYIYYRACISFLQQKYQETLGLLQQSSELNRDKVGYDYYTRLLRILALIMLQKQDETSAALTALRKYISRHEKKYYLSKRDKVILKILLLAERRGFAGPAKRTERDLVARLQQKKGEYAWGVLSNELIRFDEWYTKSPLGRAAIKQV